MSRHTAKSAEDLLTTYSRESGITLFTTYSRLLDQVILGLRILKRDHEGEAVDVARIYRHPCGELAVFSDCPLTQRTLLETVLPVMENFDAYLICLDARERAGLGAISL